MTAQNKARLIAAVAFPLLLLNVAQAHAAPPPAATQAARVDAVATQMEHISIVTAGPAKGPPIFLIPGLACPRAAYDDFIADLSKTHHVMLVQVNGFGGDDPRANLKPGVLEGIVADLDSYIMRNKLSGAKVVGHSMGGLVALMLAKAHPDDVGKLMIVDSLPYFAVLMAPPGVDPTPAMVAPQAAMMRDRVAANYGKPFSPETAEAQTKGLALKPKSIVKMKAWAAKADPRVTGQAMYEDLTTDLRPDLASIKTPITMVYPWNAGSPAKPMVDAFYRKQYAAAPHIDYVEIVDAAHMVMLDQPEAFAAALKTFATAR